MIDYEIIGTGSTGNCIILNKFIMLDCGLPFSKVKSYLNDVKVIFISHVHQDHLRKTTVKRIAYEYPTIKFITCEQNAQALFDLKVHPKNIYALKLDQWYNLGSFNARLEYLYHDVPNTCLKLDLNGLKIIYIVDTSTVDHIKAMNYDFAFIEANYEDNEKIEEEIANATKEGEFTYLKRVLNTHLSEVDAYNWLVANKITNFKFIHQHVNKEREKKDENIEQ